MGVRTRHRLGDGLRRPCPHIHGVSRLGSVRVWSPGTMRSHWDGSLQWHSAQMARLVFSDMDEVIRQSRASKFRAIFDQFDGAWVEPNALGVFSALEAYKTAVGETLAASCNDALSAAATYPDSILLREVCAGRWQQLKLLPTVWDQLSGKSVFGGRWVAQVLTRSVSYSLQWEPRNACSMGQELLPPWQLQCRRHTKRPAVCFQSRAEGLWSVAGL